MQLCFAHPNLPLGRVSNPDPGWPDPGGATCADAVPGIPLAWPGSD